MDYKIESGEDHLFKVRSFSELLYFLHSQEIDEAYRFYPFYLSMEDELVMAYSENINMQKESKIKAQIISEKFPYGERYYRKLVINISETDITNLKVVMGLLANIGKLLIGNNEHYNIEVVYLGSRYILPCGEITITYSSFELNLKNLFTRIISELDILESNRVLTRKPNPEDSAFIYYEELDQIYTGGVLDHILKSTVGNSSVEVVVCGEIIQNGSKQTLHISNFDGTFLTQDLLEKLIPKLEMYLKIYPDIFLDFRTSTNSRFMPKYLREYFIEN